MQKEEMTKKAGKKNLAWRFGFLLLLVSGFSNPAPGIKIENAYVRVAAKGMTSAAYFRISNSSDAPDTLYGAEADFAEMAQLHESYKKKGMVGMRQIDFVVVPARSSIEFKPGGYHVMLMNVKENLEVGMKVRIRLFFKQSGTLNEQAVVKK